MKLTFRTTCVSVTCLLLVLTSAVVRGQENQTVQPAYKWRLLQALHQRSAPQEDLIEEVRQGGVNFEMTPQDEEEFKAAGASPELIKAIRENYRPAKQPQSDQTICREQSLIAILLVSKDTNRKQALLVKQKLLELGYKKKQVEGLWPNKNPKDDPETSQIRYFFDEDENCAEQVRKDIEQAFPNAAVETVKGENSGAPPPKHTLQIYWK